MTKTKQVFIGIRCTKQLKESLETLARQDNRRLSDYVRIILEKHVTHEKQEVLN